MAPVEPHVKTADDGKTPLPVGVRNHGTENDQVQGGEPSTGTFTWEYVVLPPQGVPYDESSITALGQAATETAALQQGYRPSGPAHVVSVTDHPDGFSKVVTWECPVVPNTPEEAGDLAAEAKPPFEDPEVAHEKGHDHPDGPVVQLAAQTTAPESASASGAAPAKEKAHHRAPRKPAAPASDAK